MTTQQIYAEEIVGELTRARGPEEPPVYTLRNTHVLGAFDLKHRTIEVAVDIKNCKFLEEVDLRDCEFKQTVYFADCQFSKLFNSGDKTESCTVYHKDFNCTRSVFAGPFKINGAKVEGSANFSKAKFLDGKETASFVEATVGRDLFFQGATFEGDAAFHALSCGGMVHLNPATFKGRANFSKATISGDLFCAEVAFKGDADFIAFNCGGFAHFVDSTTFEGEVNFIQATISRDLYFVATFKEDAYLVYATISGNLHCSGTTFEGDADFSMLNCGGSLTFSRSTIFQGDAKFKYATVGEDIVCNGATFEGDADFNMLNCGGSAAFVDSTTFKGRANFSQATVGEHLICRKATFKRDANFAQATISRDLYFVATFKEDAYLVYATISGNLHCGGTTFEGDADFSMLNCGGSALLNPATFRGDVGFVNVTIGRDLLFQGATFEGDADFNMLNCGGSAAFVDSTTFKGRANFSQATVGEHLICRKATFKRDANFAQATISRDLRCRGAVFERDACFYRSKIGTLAVGKTFPFKGFSRLDLRECRFESFAGDPRVAKEMASTQNPQKFSRDPYIQLEKYYLGVGNDLESKRMHFTGRKELRENAKNDNGITKWGRFTTWGDFWIKWLTGYGVRTWQLLIPISILLFVTGPAVFWGPDSLLPAYQEQARVEQLYLLFREQEGAQGWYDFGQHLVERSVYSLDLFLPVVNLHVDENWQPNGLLRQIYAVFHSLVGWILVPLLLASLSGIIRRDPV